MSAAHSVVLDFIDHRDTERPTMGMMPAFFQRMDSNAALCLRFGGSSMERVPNRSQISERQKPLSLMTIGSFLLSIQIRVQKI
jgi:hypothetical protein